MKVAVNVSWMAPGQSGGMEWYVRDLIRELGAIDRDNHYTVITSPMNHHTFEELPSGWDRLLYHGGETAPPSFRATPFPHEEDELDHLEHTLARRGVDLLFCPLMYALPAQETVPVVVTIPDLQHEHLPELFDPFERGSRAMGFQDVAERATAVLGISEFVASDVAQSFDIEPERVVATPLGLSPDFAVDPDVVGQYADAARAFLRIDFPFLYFPGNAWPHKNHAALIDAFEKARTQVPDLRLILTGEQAVGGLIPDHLADVVYHEGYVARELVVGLLAAATALVFPSRFEGFGLPLLEAMAVRTPVICSDLPALREVGGDAVRYFDPDSTDSIAAAIVEIADDASLRDRLVSEGTLRLQQFSYRRTAERTLQVFREIGMGLRTPPDRGIQLRPVDGRGDLYDGHAQWHLRVPDPQFVNLQVAANPFTPTGHAHEPIHLAVCVDRQVAGEVLIEFGGSGQSVSLAVPSTVTPSSAHSIELIDLTADTRSSIGRLQVISLAIIDGHLGEVRIL